MTTTNVERRPAMPLAFWVCTGAIDHECTECGGYNDRDTHIVIVDAEGDPTPVHTRQQQANLTRSPVFYRALGGMDTRLNLFSLSPRDPARLSCGASDRFVR